MPPRAVADTNVFIAAAIGPAGTCGRLITAIAQHRWQPVVCPMLVGELSDVLHRDKFRRWIGVDDVTTPMVDNPKATRGWPGATNGSPSPSYSTSARSSPATATRRPAGPLNRPGDSGDSIC